MNHNYLCAFRVHYEIAKQSSIRSMEFEDCFVFSAVLQPIYLSSRFYSLGASRMFFLNTSSEELSFSLFLRTFGLNLIV